MGVGKEMITEKLMGRRKGRCEGLVKGIITGRDGAGNLKIEERKVD